MFARIRLPNGSETNLNVTLIRDFEPADGDQTKINFLGGDSMVVPISNRAMRNACKKALAPVSAEEAAAEG